MYTNLYLIIWIQISFAKKKKKINATLLLITVSPAALAAITLL